MRCRICRDAGWIEVIHPAALPGGGTTPAGLVRCVCGQVLVRDASLVDGPSGYRAARAAVARASQGSTASIAVLSIALLLGVAAVILAMVGRPNECGVAAVASIPLCLTGTAMHVANERRWDRLVRLLRELEPYRGQASSYTCPICAARWESYSDAGCGNELCPRCRQ